MRVSCMYGAGSRAGKVRACTITGLSGGLFTVWDEEITEVRTYKRDLISQVRRPPGQPFEPSRRGAARAESPRHKSSCKTCFASSQRAGAEGAPVLSPAGHVLEKSVVTDEI